MSLVSFEIDPLWEFKRELEAIHTPAYKEIVSEALTYVPDYIWIVPASSSGKYHPKSSLGIGGLVRHIKAVFWVGEEMLRHPIFAPFTDEEKDEIRSALLLHDMVKQGDVETPGHTVTEHPLLVRDRLYPVKLSDTDPGTQVDDLWNGICELIETHMGPWTKNRDGDEILQPPTTQKQLFVHMCDYIASRKIIEVDVMSRDAQDSNYGNKEPASKAQVGYIRKLASLCFQKGIKVKAMVLTDIEGNVQITKSDATDIITDMKQQLEM